MAREFMVTAACRFRVRANSKEEVREALDEWVRCRTGMWGSELVRGGDERAEIIFDGRAGVTIKPR